MFPSMGCGKLYQEFKKKMTNDDPDQYKFRICQETQRQFAVKLLSFQILPKKKKLSAIGVHVHFSITFHCRVFIKDQIAKKVSFFVAKKAKKTKQINI